MRQISGDIWLLEGMRRANVYLLSGGEQLILVDSGMTGSAEQIAAQLDEGGFSLSALSAIVLTHAHTDHSGSAAEVARRSGAPICAHRDEVPYIEGTQSLPARSLVTRALLWLEPRMAGGRSSIAIDRPLDDGEEPGGLRVVHTPGHTPGSMCLFHPEEGIAFCGDLFFNENPMTGRPGLRFAIPLVSADPAQVRESARKLLSLDVRVLCPGHGAPILSGAGDRIAALFG